MFGAAVEVAERSRIVKTMRGGGMAVAPPAAAAAASIGSFSQFLTQRQSVIIDDPVADFVIDDDRLLHAPLDSSSDVGSGACLCLCHFFWIWI